MSIHTFTSESYGGASHTKAVRSFLAEHGSALANGALLLGGERACGICIRLGCRIRDARSLQRSDVLDLIALHQLFMLEHVGDPDRVETALFSEMCPNDPRVHEWCKMAERLCDLLEELAISTDEDSEGSALPRGHLAA